MARRKVRAAYKPRAFCYCWSAVLATTGIRMLRSVLCLIALGVVLSFGSTGAAAAAGATAATNRHSVAKHVGKRAAKRRYSRRASRSHHGRYGFLPGYRPPGVLARRRLAREAFGYAPEQGPYYALPWPRFYRGRWNCGGFGPFYA
jgi:hypothetical protein